MYVDLKYMIYAAYMRGWAINDTTIAKYSSCTSKLQWKITESMVKIPVCLQNAVCGPLYRVRQVVTSIHGPQIQYSHL